MTEPGTNAVGLDENLSRSRDRQAGLRWPEAVGEKLDRLVEAAVLAGDRTNRKELVAALVATTNMDGQAISDMLRRYRTMRVRDALPAVRPDETVVRLVRRKPGPRALPSD